MITESILRIFRDNLKNKIIDEDINLPSGTKNAKIVTHVDLDGLISGITMVNQLEKQGIPKNRIRVELAQYGDDKKEGDKFQKKFEGKKGQFVGVTDFAKLPRVDIYDSFNKLLSFKAKANMNKILKFINITSKNSVSSLEAFKRSLMETFPNIEQNQFTDGTIKKLFNGIKSYHKLQEFYKDKPEEKAKYTVTAKNFEDFEVATTLPDFVDDHHSNENGSLSGGKDGNIAIDSPSEAEHLANKYAPGMWSEKDLKAVSMVDSAAYDDVDMLTNTVMLDKHFKGDKSKNMAIILSCLYDNLAKKDRNAAIWVIKNSQPNLGSAYLNTLRALGYNNKRYEYLNALKKGDTEKAKELLAKIPEGLNQQYDRRGEPNAKALSIEQWAEKNRKDLENIRTGYRTEGDDDLTKKGKLVQWRGLVTMFNGKDPRTQYSRFASSLYSVKGKRSPFALRYWNGGMFQMSKNTLYDGKVNFQEIQSHVFNDIKNYLKNYPKIAAKEKGKKESDFPQLSDAKIESILKSMKKNNGGHSTGIWTFSGFDQIKPTSKEYGDYWKNKDYLDRAKKLSKKTGKKAKDMLPNTYKKQNALEKDVIDKYKDMQKDTFNFAMKSALKWLVELYPPKPEDMKRLNTNDKRFEGPR